MLKMQRHWAFENEIEQLVEAGIVQVSLINWIPHYSLTDYGEELTQQLDSSPDTGEVLSLDDETKLQSFLENLWEGF